MLRAFQFLNPAMVAHGKS